ncbi:MAG: LamG-like jellyroll fold domain-containing protein [Bacteroidota bacterium]
MNLILRFPLTALVVLFAAAPALAQYPLGVGGPQPDAANAAHYDDLGNTYLVGAFRATSDFDPSAGSLALTSAGNTDAFVASYDPGGTVRWAFAIGTPGREVANDVMHQDGVLYVTGQYEGTPDFDPSLTGIATAPAGGGLDAFVAAYDVSGVTPAFLWLAPIFGPDDQIGQDLDVNAFPPFNVWATGSIVDNADFGGAVLAAAGTNSDVFVAGYDAGGGALFDAFLVGGLGRDEGLGLSLLRPNVPCVTGRFRNTADFDPSAGTFLLTSTANDDAFAACYLATTPGSPTLFAPFNAIQIGGPSVQRGYDISASPNGIRVTGTFAATTNFNGPSFPSNGSVDAFIATYDIAGSPLWVVPFGGPQIDAGLGIDADLCGNVYATGTFRAGPVDFDPFVGGASYILPTVGNYDAWIASYDAGGGFRFANRIAQNQRDIGYGVAVKTTSGAHVAAGEFGGTPIFSSGTVVSAASPITSNGSRDGYLGAYNTNGALQSVSCPAPPGGLEVWTDYDAFTGTFLDLASLTSPANNGTPVGSVATVPGVVGRAAEFPSLGDHIEIAPDPSLAVNNDDLTVDAWVQIAPTFVSDFFTIVSNFDVPDRNGYEVMLRRVNNTDWVINVTIGDGVIGFDLTSAPFPVTPSTWRFIGVTIDHDALSTTARFYVDGLPFGTATGVALGPITHAGPMYQHRSAQFGPNDELGLLDEVEVFHALLSDDDVQRIFEFGKCKPCFTADFQPVSRAASDEGLDVDFASSASSALPAALTLAPARPNPFRGQAEIDFALPATGAVSLQVFDMMGRRVATLAEGVREAGPHTVRFDAGTLPSGVYLVRLEAGGQAATRRVTLVR